MPLSLNDKVISRKELCEKFSINYEQIEKRPEFESKRTFIDRANNNKKQFGAGNSVIARILSEEKGTMLPQEIRYYTSRVKDKDGDYTYTPYRVQFEGQGMLLGEDLDLAVFAYLHPTNELSPFFKGDKGAKAAFEFVDHTKRAQAKVNNIDALGEAIVHAKTIQGQDARILAKGLGIGGVEAMSELEITAALMDYAHNQPQIYLQKKGQRITMLEGQIQHFIDKGIFKETRIGDVRTWKWDAGVKKGEKVLDIYTTTANSAESLKNHIFSNINDFVFLLNNMTENISARDEAIKALENIPDESGKMIGNALPDHLKNIGSAGKLPTNFAEGMEYLTAKTGKRVPNKTAAAFYKGVNEKIINDDNVTEWIDSNVKKKEVEEV